MQKRRIELFAADCPLCAEALDQVKGLACPDCDITVRNVKTDSEALAEIRRLGIRRVPAVVVNGRIADCCAGGIDESTLRQLGIGAPV